MALSASRRAMIEQYIGAAAWAHLDSLAGQTMATFLNKYIRDPLKQLLKEAPRQLPKLTAEMHGKSITICVGNECMTVNRVPLADGSSDEDEMPEDATDELPEV
jgi:hypothetical protein